MPQRCFGYIKVREYIRAKGFFQLLGRNVFQAVLWILNSSVIDDNIQAFQFFNGLLDCALTKFLITDISRDQKAGLTVLFDKRASLLRVFMLIQIKDRDICTFLGESNCRSEEQTSEL